jgi:uncharacterized membrane protein
MICPVDITPEPTTPEDSRPEPGNDGLPSADRMVTLSDGVVAIALTLLVLQIGVPASSMLHNPDSGVELARELAKSSDEWISYVISFYVIAQFWLVHHQVFRRIVTQRDGLAMWNFAFLFTITVMPFTSDLLGQFSENPVAVDIFALNLLLANLATRAMLEFGQRHGLLDGTGQRDVSLSRSRTLISAVVILLSIAVAWVSPTAAKLCWLLFAVAPQAADAVARIRARRTGEHSRVR